MENELEKLREAKVKCEKDFYEYNSDGTVAGDMEKRRLCVASVMADMAYNNALDSELRKHERADI